MQYLDDDVAERDFGSVVERREQLVGGDPDAGAGHDGRAQVGELRADLTMGTWQSRNDMAAGAAEANCQIGRLRRITTGQRHRDLAILMHAVDLQYGDHGDSKQHT